MKSPKAKSGTRSAEVLICFHFPVPPPEMNQFVPFARNTSVFPSPVKSPKAKSGTRSAEVLICFHFPAPGDEPVRPIRTEHVRFPSPVKSPKAKSGTRSAEVLICSHLVVPPREILQMGLRQKEFAAGMSPALKAVR